MIKREIDGKEGREGGERVEMEREEEIEREEGGVTLFDESYTEEREKRRIKKKR